MSAEHSAQKRQGSDPQRHRHTHCTDCLTHPPRPCLSLDPTTRAYAVKTIQSACRKEDRKKSGGEGGSFFPVPRGAVGHERRKAEQNQSVSEAVERGTP